MHHFMKLFGLAGRVRKHQKNYFKHRNDHDLKQSARYERELDDYIQLLLKKGYKPVFDDDRQGSMPFGS